MDNLIRVSFPNCPYKCSNGVLFNPYNSVTTPCPYCEEKRKEKIQNTQQEEDEKSIYEVLRITQQFTGSDYNFKRVIPDYAVKYVTEESLETVEKFLNEFMLAIGIGEYPEHSIMFNLGKKANAESVIIPYMLKAYENGLKVAPLLDTVSLCKMRHDLEEYGYNFAFSAEWGSSFNDYVNADICIVQIDTGVTQNGIDNVKGLMQLRATKNKPTYVFTNAWGSRIMDLCSEDEIKVKNLAYLVSVEYIKKEKKSDEVDEPVQQGKYVQPNPQISSSDGRVTGGFGVTRRAFEDLMKDRKSF